MRETRQTSPAAQPTILVVDDDDAVIGTLNFLLEDEGYRIVVARNGTEGRAAYAEIRPDLVITDIIMPNETGIALTASIRRADPAAKIIAMSGSGRIGNSNFLEMAKELGANATIAKPFDPEELLGAVRALLGTSIAPSVSVAV
ncbi:MAG: response regulator [Stellaceae bacterium]